MTLAERQRLPISDRLENCPLAFGDNNERRCAWCGNLLEGRRRRWCSDSCGEAWSRNHCWTIARAFRLHQDGHRCTRCKAREFLIEREWTSRGSLDVHHKIPVRGKHSVNGCWHHQENLETLCVGCHAEDTAKDARERAMAKRLALEPALPGLA